MHIKQRRPSSGIFLNFCGINESIRVAENMRGKKIWRRKNEIKDTKSIYLKKESVKSREKREKNDKEKRGNNKKKLREY